MKPTLGAEIQSLTREINTFSDELSMQLNPDLATEILHQVTLEHLRHDLRLLEIASDRAASMIDVKRNLFTGPAAGSYGPQFGNATGADGLGR